MADKKTPVWTGSNHPPADSGFRILSVRDQTEADQHGRRFRNIEMEISGKTHNFYASADHSISRSLAPLRREYREALASSFEAAVARGETVNLKGVTLKSFGLDNGGQKLGAVTLKSHHSGALDSSRETIKGHGKRAWTAKAYSPDKISFFGEHMPLASKQAAAIANAFGMPSWKEVEAQAKTLQAESVAAAVKPKSQSVMSIVERTMAASEARNAKPQASMLSAPRPVTATPVALVAPTGKPRTAAPAKPINSKVNDYHKRLESTLGNAGQHGAVIQEIRADKSMKAGDVKVLAKQFTGQTPTSKDAAFQKIGVRQQNLTNAALKAASRGGRSAAAFMVVGAAAALSSRYLGPTPVAAATPSTALRTKPYVDTTGRRFDNGRLITRKAG